VKAEIIAVGTEILLGEIVDTNSAWIAQSLPELGIDLYYKSVVGDNMGRIVETFERAWNRSDLLLVTGGLGPTDDDMTREGVCKLLGEEPHVDPELETRLRSFFQRRNYPMPESNLKQAWLIPSARALPNPRGTAPGWWVEKDGRIIVCMPGVPPEMQRMWINEVSPELERRSTGEVLVTTTLKTIGVGEGSVNEMIRPAMSMPGVGIGTYARADGVHIRVGAKANSREEGWLLVRPAVHAIEEIMGNSIWGRDTDTLEGWIGDRLRELGKTVATMESCTGGLLASTLTDVPGASDIFAGGLGTYATDQKIRVGVPPEVIDDYGVVSQETAKAMALAACEAEDSDYGIGITGVAGPDPLEGNPPGLVHIGVAERGGQSWAITSNMPQDRDMVKRRGVLTALLLMRRVLMGEA
jgi:nicotinamide-nucleotide amidase